jgi:eukaryotic-like serine/threonine-protein kinase
LYEALTGQLPFAGETAPQLCANVMTTEPVPPQSHRQDIPEGLASVILRCLKKDRDKRYRDVGELSQGLKAFGGPAGELAAAHVEQILGRAPSEPPITARAEAPAQETHDTDLPVVAEKIPGLPRKGLGLRVSVGLVLVVASALAVLGVRRVLKPVPIEAAALPPPTTSVAASEPIPLPPSATPDAAPSVRPKKAKVPAPSAGKPGPSEPVLSSQPAGPASAPAAPAAEPAAQPAVPEESSSGIYPVLTPVPDLPEPPAP